MHVLDEGHHQLELLVVQQRQQVDDLSDERVRLVLEVLHAPGEVVHEAVIALPLLSGQLAAVAPDFLPVDHDVVPPQKNIPRAGRG